MSQPLKGIRLLDLTHMLSGPYGSMILADLGAETIKVEPLAGEGTRKLLATDPNNSLDGMGAYYITLNRNKKSVAVDLKTKEGLALFKDLVANVDVVMSNFGAGVPERLGIDYASLARLIRELLPARCRALVPMAPAASVRLLIRWPRLWVAACRLLARIQRPWCGLVFL